MTGEQIGEPGLWIDIIKLAGHDPRCHDRSTVGTAVGADEQPVIYLPAPSHATRVQRQVGTAAVAAGRVQLEALKGAGFCGTNPAKDNNPIFERDVIGICFCALVRSRRHRFQPG